MKQKPRSLEILLVEDNPADVDLTRESLAEASSNARLHPVKDGEEAIRFLRREGEHAEAVSPDLVLLDLNLPRMDGREVLRVIKGEPGLRSVPVIVLTSSQDERDIIDSYQLHANCYITKPPGLNQFFQIAESIVAFWLSVATLPNDCRRN